MTAYDRELRAIQHVFALVLHRWRTGQADPVESQNALDLANRLLQHWADRSGPSDLRDRVIQRYLVELAALSAEYAPAAAIYYGVAPGFTDPPSGTQSG
jgi:hypothetical protein